MVLSWRRRLRKRSRGVGSHVDEHSQPRAHAPFVGRATKPNHRALSVAVPEPARGHSAKRAHRAYRPQMRAVVSELSEYRRLMKPSSDLGSMSASFDDQVLGYVKELRNRYGLGPGVSFYDDSEQANALAMPELLLADGEWRWPDGTILLGRHLLFRLWRDGAASLLRRSQTRPGRMVQETACGTATRGMVRTRQGGSKASAFVADAERAAPKSSLTHRALLPASRCYSGRSQARLQGQGCRGPAEVAMFALAS